MKKKITKFLVLSLILGLIPILSGCGQKADPDSLKERYNTVSKTFKQIFEEGKVQIHGKVTGYSNPSIKMVLAEALNADPNLFEEKMPNYKNFDGSEYDKYQLDDGFLAVSKDFYIIINNDGADPYNMQLYIDTNGAAGPNRMGYDLFKYNVEPGDKLIPLDETADVEMSKDYFESINEY